MNPGFWLSALFLLSNVGIPKAADQCCEGQYSVSGMFLKGHVFKTVETHFPSDLECYRVCNQDIRCQSYNVIIDKHICELNNRTKEARPEDLLPDARRIYMKRTSSRGIIRYLLNSKGACRSILSCFVILFWQMEDSQEE